MVCCILAVYGLSHLGYGVFSTIGALALLVDAFIGFYLFVTERKGDLASYLHFFQVDIKYFKKKFVMSRPSLSRDENDGYQYDDNDFMKI